MDPWATQQPGSMRLALRKHSWTVFSSKSYYVPFLASAFFWPSRVLVAPCELFTCGLRTLWPLSLLVLRHMGS